MRRATILLVLLLVLSVGGVCFAASGVYEARDQVTLTEDVRYGDRSAANGLTVRVDSTYNDHLFWDTTCTLDAQTRTETEYSFSASAVNETRPRAYSGISLSAQPLFGLDLNATAGLGLAYLELFNSLEPGEEKSAVVYLKDYMDYYPISVSLDLPGAYDSLEGSEVPDWDPDPGTPSYALFKIRDYFKIPVLEEEFYEISVKKYEAGNVNGASGMDATGSDHFNMTMFSALTDDACYFTFDAHSQEGKLMDVSELPDGYGIYRLPYEEDRRDESNGKIYSVDADALEMVYPLGPEITPVSMSVDPEQSKLLLHAMEEDEYSLTVIDIETMATLQKLEIEGAPEEIYEEGGYLAILLSGSRLAVVAVTDSGGYELRWICDVSPDEFENTLFWRGSALAFDGERLAVVGQPIDEYGRYYDDSCNFSLAVYEPSGLAYYGEYWNSLSAGGTGAWYDRCRGCMSVHWTGGT